LSKRQPGVVKKKVSSSNRKIDANLSQKNNNREGPRFAAGGGVAYRETMRSMAICCGGQTVILIGASHWQGVIIKSERVEVHFLKLS